MAMGQNDACIKILPLRSNLANAITAILKELKRRIESIIVTVEVTVLLYPPDKRNRDLDNYQKALFDSLTHAGVWVDDMQIKRFTVEWGEQVKQGKTEVIIQPFNGVDFRYAKEERG